MSKRVLRHHGVAHEVPRESVAAARVVHANGADLVLDVGGRIVRGVVVRAGERLTVHHAGMTYEFEVGSAAAPSAEAPSRSEIHAPMTGRVVVVSCKQGEAVAAGTPLLVIEAMKMEHKIVAPEAATVVALHVAQGDQVDVGALMVLLKLGASG